MGIADVAMLHWAITFNEVEGGWFSPFMGGFGLGRAAKARIEGS